MVRIVNGEIVQDSARPASRASAGHGNINSLRTRSAGAENQQPGSVSSLRASSGGTARAAGGIGRVRAAEAAGGTTRAGSVGTLRHDNDSAGNQANQAGGLGGIGGDGEPFNLGRYLGLGAEPVFSLPAFNVAGFRSPAIDFTAERILMLAIVYGV